MGKAPRRVADNEALAVGTTIRGSAQKLNLVAGLIRGKKAEEALNILAFSKKAMARDATKVLASAIANAENNHNLDVDALVVAEASVGKSKYKTSNGRYNINKSKFKIKMRTIIKNYQK